MTKGVDFLVEAERLRDVDESKGEGVSLASLQGTLLLYERFVSPSPLVLAIRYPDGGGKVLDV